MHLSDRRERIGMRVTRGQLETIRAKAAEYGVPVSELMLRATEAYVRTRGPDCEGDDAVAVNYGVWAIVADDLARIERALRETAQLLAGAARATSALAASGSADAASCEAAHSSLRSARDDVAALRPEVARALARHEAACDAAAILDPMTPPLERGPGRLRPRGR